MVGDSSTMASGSRKLISLTSEVKKAVQHFKWSCGCLSVGSFGLPNILGRACGVTFDTAERERGHSSGDQQSSSRDRLVPRWHSSSRILEEERSCVRTYLSELRANRGHW